MIDSNEQNSVKSEEKESKINTLIKCLTECNNNASLIVVRVNAGMMAKKRLADLGIVPGTEIVKRRSAPFRGPLEIYVKGSKLAIGRGLAQKIIVSCDPTRCPV